MSMLVFVVGVGAVVLVLALWWRSGTRAALAGLGAAALGWVVVRLFSAPVAHDLGYGYFATLPAVIAVAFLQARRRASNRPR